MKPSTKVSFVCFLLIALLELVIAFRFLTASQIMDYHQVAMGTNWADMSEGAKVMTLNFMRSAGVGFLLAGIAISYLIFIPLRRGENWSRWALASICLTQAVVMGLVVVNVEANTSADTPLTPFVIMALLGFVGFLSYGGLKKGQQVNRP